MNKKEELWKLINGIIKSYNNLNDYPTGSKEDTDHWDNHLKLKDELKKFIDSIDIINKGE